MNTLKKIAITICALGALLFCVYVALIIYINSPSDIVLAKEIYVTDDWNEILFTTPIAAQHRHQSIGLKIPNIDWDSGFEGIRLQDGTTLRPTLELIDDMGSVQPLRLSEFTKKFGVVANYSAAHGTPGFSEDRKFVKLRIRNDIPFTCTTIAWVDYDPK